MKKVISYIVIVSIIAVLSACGRVSKAVPVEGSSYPHSYPRI